MNRTSKKTESLKDKLKIQFSPKLIASNPTLQPIYEVILSLLKSTEFWEDLERAIDATISEIEQKIVSHVLSMNFKSFESNETKICADNRKSKPQALQETMKFSAQKNESESKSVYSHVDKKLTDTKKLISQPFIRTKNYLKNVHLFTERSKPASGKQQNNVQSSPSQLESNEQKKSILVEQKVENLNESVTSNMSWASDLLKSDEFLAKMAFFMNQQLAQDPNIANRFISNSGLNYQQSMPVTNAFKKSAKVEKDHAGKKSVPQKSDKSSDYSGIKEDQFSDIQKDITAAALEYDKHLNGQASEEVYNNSRANAKEHSLRYSKKGKRDNSAGQEHQMTNPNNMFKVGISEEERPQSVSVSDHTSNESYTSDQHEKKLELLKKNIVRRESLSKSAGLAFSFGKVPTRSIPIADQMSYTQQVSNFE